MVINFEKLLQLADILDNEVICLGTAKEKIELEGKRFAANSGTEGIIAEIKKTAGALEEKSERLKKLEYALIRISELYQSGERRIEEKAEGGIKGNKTEFVAGKPIGSVNSFGWKIE